VLVGNLIIVEPTLFSRMPFGHPPEKKPVQTIQSNGTYAGIFFEATTSQPYGFLY